MEIISKVKQYCARQERSPLEVKQKLYQWGIGEKERNEIIKQLGRENFLSEERFAKLYAVSKFHQKKWGKQKIAAGLQKHNINAEIIMMALNEINGEEYKNTLQKIILIKAKSAPDREKIIRYCLQKGYEPDILEETLKKIP